MNYLIEVYIAWSRTFQILCCEDKFWKKNITWETEGYIIALHMYFETLCYKVVGREVESQLGQWNFLIYVEYQESSWRLKGGRPGHKTSNLTVKCKHFFFFTKRGSFDVSETYAPPRPTFAFSTCRRKEFIPIYFINYWTNFVNNNKNEDPHIFMWRQFSNMYHHFRQILRLSIPPRRWWNYWVEPRQK
jgi:hypothetical protein